MPAALLFPTNLIFFLEMTPTVSFFFIKSHIMDHTDFVVALVLKGLKSLLHNCFRDQ